MNQVQKFLVKFYLGVGTTMGKRLARAASHGQWDVLQGQSLSDPSCYQNAMAYRKAAWCVDITRKLLLPGDSNRRREAAIETFWLCEAECARTNARLSRFVGNQGPFGTSDLRVVEFITLWRKELKRVLGRAPKPWSLTPRFSGGSTLSDAGKLITIPDKMSSERTAYARSLDIIHDAHYATILSENPLVVCRSNRFFTVPKDNVKDRGCCVEASANVGLQLALGAHMKGRYRKAYGVDLRRAQYLHRGAARRASITGEYATIDLSNASDTVACQLVKLVLPDDWWVLLNSLRAPTTDLDGQVVWLQKFSSMGNGFTFELETLLFKTLCDALGASYSSVYGDDIIVNVDKAQDVLSALRFFGFTPNKKKTFCEGPFRESCGGDFFDGQPVRAHFLKEIPDEPQKWLVLANGLRRLDPELSMLHAAWRFCVDQLPINWRNYGPADLGDCVLHDPDALRHARMRTYRHEVGGIRSTSQVLSYKAMVPVVRTYDLTKYWKPKVAIVAASLGVPPQVSTRDEVIGYKSTWIPAYGVADVQAGFDNAD